MRLATPLIDGNVCLKTLDCSAASGPYLSWMQNDEITRFLESRFSTHSIQSLTEFINTTNASKHNLLAGIFVDGDHVGNIKLSFDPNHLTGSIGIIVGDKYVWGQGIGRRAIRLLTEHAFLELKIEKLTAGCYELNLGSIKAFEACGFKTEAIYPAHYIYEGKRISRICMSRFNPTCKGLV